MTDGDSDIGSNYRLLGPGGDALNSLPDGGNAHQRIQALLAQWLRMENVVVLLGAGASKSQNGLLIRDLEKAVLEVMSQCCSDSADLGPMAPVVTARLKAIGEGKTEIHFEQWLSYLTNAEHILGSKESPITSIALGSAAVSRKCLQAFLKVAAWAIYAYCSLRLGGTTDGGVDSGHHALVGKLVARDPNFGRAHVFTTNYDSLIEQALDQLGVRYSDGFVGTVERRFDASSYGLDIYYPGEVAEGRVRRFDKFLHLYKLHGSVHWRFSESGRFVQTAHDRLKDCEIWRGKSLQDRSSELLKWAENGETAVGILPTANKFVQTLALPFAHLFRSLHQRLQVPQTFLLVIGYSFGDEHINAVIDDAMTNPSLVLLVVTPSADDKLKRRIESYQRAGERAFLLTGLEGAVGEPRAATFDDFSKSLLPNVQWMDDFVKLRRMENEIAQAKRRRDEGPDKGV